MLGEVEMGALFSVRRNIHMQAIKDVVKMLVHMQWCNIMSHPILEVG